jgi:hypothetical protein
MMYCATEQKAGILWLGATTVIESGTHTKIIDSGIERIKGKTPEEIVLKQPFPIIHFHRVVFLPLLW